MNVTMTDIKKLREMTGAGLSDCKKALAESEDMDGAVAYLRKKGQAVAAKRSDREAAEGCVLVKAVDGFGAIIALKCETDFVSPARRWNWMVTPTLRVTTSAHITT